MQVGVGGGQDVVIATKKTEPKPYLKSIAGMQANNMTRVADGEGEDNYTEGIFVYNEKEFSFGASAFVAPLKTRLVKLMGSDIIRILDREWINELGLRIEKNYEEELKIQEKRLQEAEIARTLRLASSAESSLPVMPNNNNNNSER